MSLFQDQYPNRNPSVLAYWGSILSSAQAGASVAGMWSAIRDQQARFGEGAPRVSAADVMALRGYANRVASSARALEGAAASDALLPSMMANAPYSDQGLAGLAATPGYQVTYRHEFLAADGTTQQAWRTSWFTGADLPQTVGGLLAAADANAVELAGVYGVEHVGVSGITIAQV